MTNEEILASATQKREDKEDEENGIDIFDDPAVKPSCIEITNALTCVFFKKLETTCQSFWKNSNNHCMYMAQLENNLAF